MGIIRAHCKCGRPIVFDRFEGNLAIYRCLSKTCQYACDLLEEEREKISKQQEGVVAEGNNYKS